jgi:hypothetical protein
MLLVTFVRRSYWGVFYYSHKVLAVASLVMIVLHSPSNSYVLIAPLALYFIDLAVRSWDGRVAVSVESATVQVSIISNHDIYDLLSTVVTNIL